MEVKIKQGTEMLDATIEMIDGVMVVSPKEVKFKPKYGDDYYTPIFDNTYFVPFHCSWTESALGNARYEKGLCFKTREECEEFCNRLNDVINSVKP